MPKVVRSSAGCLYTDLHGHSRSGRLRMRFTDFPHGVDMRTWTNPAEYDRPVAAWGVSLWRLPGLLMCAGRRCPGASVLSGVATPGTALSGVAGSSPHSV